MSIYQQKPAKRKRQVYCAKEPPFPVPIESVTDVSASNARWRYYTGFLSGNQVLVKHSGDMQYLFSMGFFGEGNLSDRGLIGDASIKVISRRRYLHRLSWTKKTNKISANEAQESDDDGIKEYDEICEAAASGGLTCTGRPCSETEPENVSPRWQTAQARLRTDSVDGQNSNRCEEEDDKLTHQQEGQLWENQNTNATPSCHQESDWSGEADFNFWGVCDNTESQAVPTSKVSDLKQNISSAGSSRDLPRHMSPKEEGSEQNQAMFEDITEFCSTSEVIDVLRMRAEENSSLSEAHNHKEINISHGEKSDFSPEELDEDQNVSGVQNTQYEIQSLVNENSGRLIVEDDSNDEDGIDIRQCRKDWRLCRKVDPHPPEEYLQLTLQEAYFLSFGLGCLVVFDQDQNKLDLVMMWKLFSDLSDMFIPNYIAYHHFRSKGWVPKIGVKFGADYILYRQGPPFYHASFTVLIQPLRSDLKPDPEFKGQPLSWTQLSRFYRVTEQVSKELLLCNVIRPSYLTEEQLYHPSCISKFKVKETILKRWIPSQERENKQTLPV